MQEEGGDQMWVAAEDAELAAELLFPVGHGAGTPLPPTVREAAVETVPNHEDMGCPEHQIRLSKRVIAKFVMRLGLWAHFAAPKKVKATAMVAFCFSLHSVTETVSISRVANRVG